MKFLIAGLGTGLIFYQIYLYFGHGIWNAFSVIDLLLLINHYFSPVGRDLFPWVVAPQHSIWLFYALSYTSVPLILILIGLAL